MSRQHHQNAAASDTLRVVLCALPGFGNTVLEALLPDVRVVVEAVFTVGYDRPFPYYEEQQLTEMCRQRNVRCHDGVRVSGDQGLELLDQARPDLIIVATFKQILRSQVLNLPRLGVVNLHPSLLPRYRGPCPTSAALLNDDTVSGVTAHYVNESLDDGDILLQRSVPIDSCKNDGEVRRTLAQLAGSMTPELVGLFAGFRRPTGSPQVSRDASPAPRPKPEDGYLERAADPDEIRRRIRAFNPLPGTSILVGNRRILVDDYEIVEDGRPVGLYENPESVHVLADAGAIKLTKVHPAAQSPAVT